MSIVLIEAEMAIACQAVGRIVRVELHENGEEKPGLNASIDTELRAAMKEVERLEAKLEWEKKAI